MSNRNLSTEDLSESEIGAMRWRAIEAANSAPGISPVARRVLTALITVMDGKTRECFPSELWLSKFLGVHKVSVKKAKAELREEHGLIHWDNPGGPRHLSRYTFNWQKLLRLSEEAKSRAREAVDERRTEKSTYGSQTATYSDAKKGSHTATIQPVENEPKVAVSLPQGSHFAIQGSRFATPKVAASLPKHPYIIPTISSELITPSSGQGRVTSAPLPSEREVRSKGACEGKVLTPVARPRCPYPRLIEAFADNPNMVALIERLGPEQQEQASRLLAMKGKDRVLDFLSEAA